MDKLSEFVNEQIRAGVKAPELKSHLLRNGWRENEVDSAISYAVGRRVRQKIGFAFVIVLIIAILAFSLISLTKTPAIKTTVKPGTGTNTNVEMKTSTVKDCAAIEDSMDKDACYQKFVNTGFDCRTLSDNVENTYCTRALEETMLKGVGEISEN